MRAYNSVMNLRFAVLLLLLSAPLHAADPKGSADHPMISRYQGAEIIRYETRAFESVELVSAPIVAYDHRRTAANDDSYTRVEGRYTRIAYAAPQGRTSVEVFRNYEEALKAGGFEIVFSCETAACDTKHSGRAFNLAASPSDLHSKMTSQHDEQRYLLAKLPRATGDVYASIYIVAATKLGGSEKHRVFINQIVVESKPMEGGKVKVDAAAMSKGLDAQGHVALYEILFDTNKDVLKPESDAALTEIARLLKDKGDLKVLIVGHTDNVGELAPNQVLSEKRARAVADALVGKHGIARERLSAVGVGMAAPVDTNATESGRARNRRVELVKR